VIPLRLLAALLAGAATASPAAIALPGGEGGIGFDDLRFSAPLRRILAPAGRTGRLDLVDPGSGAVDAVDGFTRSAPARGGHGDGTTSADAGARWVFAIDRGDRTLAVVDPRARRIVARARLGGGPDYVRWVEPTQEVWVTEPGRQVVEIFRLDGGDAPRLVAAATIAVPGGPESLVVDPARGRAYTNTFRDATVALDLRAHAVAVRWTNGCEGARGIELDAARGLVFVGCEEGKVVALDAAHGGRLGEAKAGDGVDGIAYAAALGHLYVPAEAAGTLTVVGVGDQGALAALGALPAARGAHCAAADDAGNVFVCDPHQGRLLVLRDPYPPRR
jgi:DNA-binding beta-propeller fold protein YncE